MLVENFVRFAEQNSFKSKLICNSTLKDFTTFKIGGPADVIFIPANIVELQEATVFLHKENIPITILGWGSNVLVSDKGIRGVVIIIGKNLAECEVKGNIITAQAGASITDVTKLAVDNALGGLEFAIGIPGSVGGAVFMNAGAYGGEFSYVVERVNSIDAAGNIKTYERDRLNFAYRHSVFQDNMEVIVSVDIKLTKADKAVLNATIGDFTEKRNTKQPLDMPSAGSVFKRPVGYFAGTLIEQAGLKGHFIGGAQVSPKHAGFIVNKGGATAQDVLALIEHIKSVVFEKFAVQLESEVRFIGER